jgi:hypothetical protein
MVRLYIPSHIKPVVVEQYHDINGHMGIDKTFEAIRNKYYWPNMFKEMYDYVTTCVACQTRNFKKVRAPMQETHVPPYPFCHIGVDVSGPYPTTLSENKYIIGFIDLYSGWPEAFSVPAKTTDNVAHLLIEESIPRHLGIQILTSDNGGENCSKVMQEVCEELNIKHIKTSFYHPQGNAKIERFHRTLHDIVSKLTADNPKSWDLFLNQALAVIRFNPSDTTKCHPSLRCTIEIQFCLWTIFYNHDVNIMENSIINSRWNDNTSPYFWFINFKNVQRDAK